MIKKLFALVLIISMFPVTYQVVQAETDISYEQDINILDSFGLFDTFEGKDAEDLVTRAEFASAVVDILNMYADYSENGYFYDVTSTHPYFEKVSKAAVLGVVKGDGTYFYPDRNITYTEAAVMLLNAMGYKHICEIEGGYSAGYLNKASSLEFTKNLEVGGNTQLTVGMTARLLINAGEAPILVHTGDDNLIGASTGDTLFWARHKISSGKGVYSQNQYSIDDLPAHTIKIDDFYGKMMNNSLETEYIGYYVQYYYREEDGENIVYYVEPKGNKNDVEVILDENIKGYDRENRVLSYYDGKKDKSVTLNSEVTVIYNGCETVDYYYMEDNLEKSIFDILDGEVKLIDNNCDGNVDYINILSFKDCFVTGVDKEKNLIIGKNKQEFDFEWAKNKGYSWIITDVEGKICDISNIEEGTVISYVESLDKRFYRGIKTDKTVVGIIESCFENNGIWNVKIEGLEYKVSKHLQSGESIPSTGSEVTAYINYNGKICYFETKNQSGVKYGFVIKKYYDEDLDRYGLKLLTQDNVKLSLPCAKTLSVDGNRFTGAGLTNYMRTFSDNQVIRFQMNADGEFIMIDTTQTGTKGENDILRQLPVAQKLTYYPNIKNYGGKVIIPEDAIIFKTPDVASKNIGNADSYYITALPTVSTTSMNLKVYSHEENSIAANCVQYLAGEGAVDAKSPYMLVKDVKKVSDANDEAVLRFDGISGEGEVSYLLSADYIFNSENANATDAKSVKKGDVIKYNLDDRGRIDYISAVYTMGTEGLGAFGVGGSWFDHGIYYGMVGYLWKRDGQIISLVSKKAELESCEFPENVVTASATTKICRVSSANDRVEVKMLEGSDISIMKDYINNNHTTPIFAANKAGKLEFVVFYEE